MAKAPTPPLIDSEILELQEHREFIKNYRDKPGCSNIKLAEKYVEAYGTDLSVDTIRNALSDKDNSKRILMIFRGLRKLLEESSAKIDDGLFYKYVDAKQKNSFSPEEKANLFGNYLLIRYAASEPEKIVVSHFSIYNGYEKLLKFNAIRVPFEGKEFKTEGHIIKGEDNELYSWGYGFYSKENDNYIESYTIKNNTIDAKKPLLGFFNGVLLTDKHGDMKRFLSKVILFKIKDDKSFEALNKTDSTRNIFGKHEKSFLTENEFIKNVISLYECTSDGIFQYLEFDGKINFCVPFIYQRH